MSKFIGFLLGVAVALVGPAMFGVLAADGGIELNAKEMALAYGIGALIFWTVVSYFSGAGALGAALAFGVMIYAVNWIPNRTRNFLNDIPGVTTGMIDGTKQYTLNGVVPILAVISLIYAIQLIVQTVQRNRRERAEEERRQREQELALAQQQAEVTAPYPAQYPVAGGDYPTTVDNRLGSNFGNSSYDDLFDEDPEPYPPRNTADDEQTAQFANAAGAADIDADGNNSPYADDDADGNSDAYADADADGSSGAYSDADADADGDSSAYSDADDTVLVPTDKDETVVVPTAGSDAAEQTAADGSDQADQGEQGDQSEQGDQPETSDQANQAEEVDEATAAGDDSTRGDQGQTPAGPITGAAAAPAAPSAGTPAGPTATPAAPTPGVPAGPTAAPAAPTPGVPAGPTAAPGAPTPGASAGPAATPAAPSAGSPAAPLVATPASPAPGVRENGAADNAVREGGAADNGVPEHGAADRGVAGNGVAGNGVPTSGQKFARNEEVGQQYRERMDGPELEDTGEFAAFENPNLPEEDRPQAPRVMDLPGQFRPAGA